MNIYIYHDKTQLEAPSITEKSMKEVIAKNIIGENLNRYYLRVVGSEVINPAKISIQELKQLDVIFIEVSKEHFELYVKALTNQTRTPFSSIGRLVNA